jgi:hypothetical protein
MSGPRFDAIRRHPFCPECNYDLVATIDAGRNVCPECGYEFELHEPKRQRLPEDWTIWRGLGKACGVLLLRSLVCLAAWTLVLWGVTAPATWLASGRNWRIALVVSIVALLLLLVAAGVIARQMAKGMDEIAGVTSIFVAALVITFAWGVFIAGTQIVQAISSLGTPAANGAAIVACGVAAIIIIKTHLFDEY